MIRQRSTTGLGDFRLFRSSARPSFFFAGRARCSAAGYTNITGLEAEIAQTSALHLDLLRDIKLINSHLVAAAAYPILERSGELLPSRISRQDAS